MWLPIAKVLSYLSCSWLFFHYGNKRFKDLRWSTVIPIFLIVETQEKRQRIWLCTLGVLAGGLIFFVIMSSMGPEHINVQQSRFFADRYLGGINGYVFSQTRPHVIVYRPSSLYRYYITFDYESFHNQIQSAVSNRTLFQVDIAPDLMLVGNNVPSLMGVKNDMPAKGI